MLISAAALKTLILVATGLAAIAPLVLFILWLKDRHKGDLW